MRPCRCRASRPASRARCRRGRWCVFCLWWGAGVCSKKQRGAPTAAGRAGIECAVVGGGGAFMTTGGIEPPLLWYESIPLTSGPVQASYPMLRVCSTNMHMQIYTYHYITAPHSEDSGKENQNTSTPLPLVAPAVLVHTSRCTVPLPSTHDLEATGLCVAPRCAVPLAVYTIPNTRPSLLLEHHAEQWHMPYTRPYAWLS